MSSEKKDDSSTKKLAEEFEFIATYTRAQALEDGVLIDVSERMKEVGITLPTALDARGMAPVRGAD